MGWSVWESEGGRGRFAWERKRAIYSRDVVGLLYSEESKGLILLEREGAGLLKSQHSTIWVARQYLRGWERAYHRGLGCRIEALVAGEWGWHARLVWDFWSRDWAAAWSMRSIDQARAYRKRKVRRRLLEAEKGIEVSITFV